MRKYYYFSLKIVFKRSKVKAGGALSLYQNLEGQHDFRLSRITNAESGLSNETMHHGIIQTQLQHGQLFQDCARPSISEEIFQLNEIQANVLMAHAAELTRDATTSPQTNGLILCTKDEYGLEIHSTTLKKSSRREIMERGGMEYHDRTL
ncbi:hypothetical protein CHS0354_036960 [Potamilus streckersoni]|uniref:Uncharacterized protein n=1 Tax=Potamilus streckersoni TaxID=2493646 RepID=A0AAE0W9S6_9BIVA|nr:hypothetical protein CHS0354_036960 [Potamilus streckersoni]